MLINKDNGMTLQPEKLSGPRLKIWVDMSSPPQILFFSAVIPQLRTRGHEVIATAEGFDHCEDLLRQHQVDATVIGTKYQKGPDERLRNIAWKNRQRDLERFISKFRFDLAASYGSSTQASVAAQLCIPLFTGTDYEYVNLSTMRHARRVMIPEVVPETRFIEAGVAPGVIKRYPGQKEHVYLGLYRIAEDLRSKLGISEDEFVILFRPESDLAHYLDDHAAGFPKKILATLLKRSNVRILLIPRNETQRSRLRKEFGHHDNLQILDRIHCGPSLIAASDFFVGGGGSMIREAAVLGVPAASCFEGRSRTWKSWNSIAARKSEQESLTHRSGI
jgi:predicted glycosyltransferase